MEDAVDQLAPLYEPLQRWFLPGEFKDEGKLIKAAEEALYDDFFICFVEMLLVASKAIGREASWNEGCYCHESTLTGSDSYKERRREMEKTTGAPTCIWKAKRMPSYALRHGKLAVQRVKAATSPRYQATLLRVRVSVSVRVKKIGSL